MDLLQSNRNAIHFYLIGAGFSRVGSVTKDVYRKEYAYGEVKFPVKVLIADPLFTTKPIVLLEKKPAGLALNVPHLIADKILCYLDDAGVEFDVYSPIENMSLVLYQLEQLLELYSKRPESLEEEFRRELPAYWHAYGDDVYLIATDLRGDISYRLKVGEDKQRSLDGEIVIANEERAIEHWGVIRNLKGNSISGKGFILELPDTIKLDLDAWPPSCVTEVADWLQTAGLRNRYQKLVTKLTKQVLEDGKCLVVLKVREMFLGFVCMYTSQASRKLIQDKRRGAGRGTKGRNKGQPLRLAEQIGLLRSLQRHEPDNGFFRFSVTDARPSIVTQRNLSDDRNLSGLSIGLVGCGTIGGYVASLLCQAGAGSGGGTLALYDHDNLMPENLGRHYLSAGRLGENKALALADDIASALPYESSLNGYSTRFDCSNSKLISSFDLIIDATGDITGSSVLSHTVHHKQLNTPIIYGWIDARGLAARALLCERESPYACYCCLKQRSGSGAISERFPLFKEGVTIPEWRARPCGIGGYLPFSSQASVTTAGLVQALAIGWANGNASPRFRHVSLDERVIHTKNANPSRLRYCPSCQT